jgi:RNA 2',3'-cyclic 3'-phosphodiesterase
MPETMRTFIAIDLPQECKGQIKDLQIKLKSSIYRGIKWATPESIHITLKFMGDVRVKDVAAIGTAIEASVQKVSPFTLKMAGTGFFPGENNIRVFWIGLTHDVDKLIVLQSGIDNSLSKLGYQRETRPFSAHLTLARFTDTFSRKDKSTFVNSVQKINYVSDIPIAVTSVRLMRSQLTPRGAVHTLISDHKLGN